MNYNEIDKIMNPFMKKFGLYAGVMEEWDNPIRIIAVVDDAGNGYKIQIGLENEEISICIWDKKIDKNNKVYKCDILSLKSTLYDSYKYLENCFKEAGTKRTFVW